MPDARREPRQRVVVGITGDERLAAGLRLLEALDALPVEVHVVASRRASAALGPRLDDVKALAEQLHPYWNQAAKISSGSFLTRGMVILPCSPGSASAVGLGLARNLVERAADVTLKEQRPLVLCLPAQSLRGLDADLVARLASVPGLELLAFGDDPDEGVDRALAAIGLTRAVAPL